jgi:hypothetical protein
MTSQTIAAARRRTAPAAGQKNAAIPPLIRREHGVWVIQVGLRATALALWFIGFGTAAVRLVLER